MTKPKTVVSQFIPSQADLMAAMDDFVQNTSYDVPAESIEDPEPAVGAADDAGTGDANVTAKAAKPAKKLDSTIIQL